MSRTKRPPSSTERVINEQKDEKSRLTRAFQVRTEEPAWQAELKSSLNRVRPAPERTDG